jgi:hypothetical protein
LPEALFNFQFSGFASLEKLVQYLNVS